MSSAISSSFAPAPAPPSACISEPTFRTALRCHRPSSTRDLLASWTLFELTGDRAEAEARQGRRADAEELSGASRASNSLLWTRFVQRTILVVPEACRGTQTCQNSDTPAGRYGYTFICIALHFSTRRIYQPHLTTAKSLDAPHVPRRPDFHQITQLKSGYSLDHEWRGGCCTGMYR